MATADVLVIGGGPAGLAAATALVRQLHTVVVFDSGSYRNGMSKHLHNLPTWDHKDPGEFRAVARKDLLSNYKTATFEDTEIQTLKEVPGGFEAQDGSGKTWTGKKVILATGVADDFPDIDGYVDCWGKRIYHCLFCHGYEEKGGASAGVLAVQMCANPRFALHLARNASQLAQSVTIYTNGSEQLRSDLITALGEKSPITADSRSIKRLSMGEEGKIVLEFEDGSTKAESFLAHAPLTHPKGPFVEQLGLKLAPPLNDIEVTPPFLQTSKRGVFAAGDNMIMAKAVPTAIANGSMAANGASTQLQAEMHGHEPMF